MDSHRDLESALRAAGRGLAYPPTPNLGPAVVATVGALPARAPRRAWRPGRSGFAVALAILAAVATLLVPQARDTVAGWLHLRGLRVETVPRGTLPSPSAPGSPAAGDLRDQLDRRLDLRGRVTLARARAAGFATALPASLAAPDRVYLETTPLGSQVSLLYYPSANLPPSTDPGVGLLLTVTRTTLETAFIRKFVEGDNTTIDIVRVHGADAVWIGGHPHAVFLSAPGGDLNAAALRLAGNTLVWQQGDLTFRLEAGLDRTAAVALADSFQP
ncbi:MAG: hypothetical protein ACYDGR_05535 [Candidatus Dormibacteria bacterium]